MLLADTSFLLSHDVIFQPDFQMMKIGFLSPFPDRETLQRLFNHHAGWKTLDGLVERIGAVKITRVVQLFESDQAVTDGEVQI